MAPQIKITIEGSANSGKTAFALLVSSALEYWGFKTVINDDDVVRNTHRPEWQKVRLRQLAKYLGPVQIVTKQKVINKGADT